MKFSEQWLRSLVNPPLDTDSLAHVLTMAGLEVEHIEAAAADFSGVVVAQVLEVAPHPGADRLRVCRVDAGSGAPHTIVCGAPNVAAGQKVPCALPGAKLPGIEIRETELRGVASSGMLCSAAELRVSEDSSGILVLSADAPVGADFRSYYELDDRLLTLKLTANRGDCLSVSGIAREVAALTDSTLHPVEIAPVVAQIPDTLAVNIEAREACRRYAGRIIRSVNARAATPLWMVRRLEKSGVRSISAVVDITNYVMLELGQPLHAFDLAKLQGGIHVRTARTGERLLCLNDRDVELSPEFLVIADANGPVALAGIMGGAPTAVDAATADVFLESAFFDPKAIGGRTRKLGFTTDSSHRFERGVDFEAAARALDRASALIVEFCGGKPGPITDERTRLPERLPVRLRPDRVPRVLGIDLARDAVASILDRLSMSVRHDGDALLVTPPSYRFDIAIEEDLIEEVARVHGYDRIEPRPICSEPAMLPVSESRRSLRDMRQSLALRDYQEVITYAFVDPAWEADLGSAPPLRLANPIASQMSVMRTTLVGGLVDRVQFNLNRRQGRVRLFEVGTLFLGESEAQQPLHLAGIALGPAFPEQWGSAERNVDFFDVKADLEEIARPLTLTFEAASHRALHPGRSARILCASRPIGWIGELHPRLQQKYEMPVAPVVFEVAFHALQHVVPQTYREISRFPQLRRDLALVVDEKVAAQGLLECLRRATSGLVAEVILFDVYRGKGLENGKKSLAFAVLLQDTQKTLTDEEADAAIVRLIAAAKQEYGASLRQ
jgi:phenylalanyl-tRNA synthetase beta chain